MFRRGGNPVVVSKCFPLPSLPFTPFSRPRDPPPGRGGGWGDQLARSFSPPAQEPLLSHRSSIYERISQRIGVGVGAASGKGTRRSALPVNESLPSAKGPAGAIRRTTLRPQRRQWPLRSPSGPGSALLRPEGGALRRHTWRPRNCSPVHQSC